MSDLASRLASRVQLTSDGYKVCMDAVDAAFGQDIYFAMLVKTYGLDERRTSFAISKVRLHMTAGECQQTHRNFPCGIREGGEN
jgi:hypothetical protein